MISVSIYRRLFSFRPWGLALLLLIGAGTVTPGPAASQEVQLSVQDVRQRVLESNRQYLSAGEEVVKAHSDIVKARAGAFPEVNLHGYYNRNFSIAPVFFEADGEVQQLKFGFENNFGASISLRQPLWEGGKVFTAYSIAKQYHQYTQAGVEQVAAATVHTGELLFFKAIFDKARQEVLEQALKTAEHSLDVVTKLYSQGMVSRFELLRSQVERSNILPQLLAAQSEVRLSEKRLLSYLDMELDQSVSLIEPSDDTALGDLPSLTFLVDTALASRQEMRQADLMVDMRRRAVRVARAGYFPSLAAVSRYDWQSQSDEFSLSKNTSTSFTAGITLSFPIFDGGITRSEVGRMKAEHRQTLLNQRELEDRIRLEVEQAYDELLQTTKTVEIHSETIAQAEEGLRIAELRYEAGEGTLLEVLSAQTALTDARTSLAQARFALRRSLAGLKLATTIDITGK